MEAIVEVREAIGNQREAINEVHQLIKKIIENSQHESVSQEPKDL